MNVTTLTTVILGVVLGCAVGAAGYLGVIELPLVSGPATDAETELADGTEDASLEPKIDPKQALFDKAEAYLEKNPHDRRRTLLFGGTLVEAQEYGRAEKFYLSRLKAKPDDSELLYGLGWCYENAKQWSDAAKAYEMACDANFRNITASNNLAWVLATAPDDSVRDGKRAIRLAKRGMQLAPNFPAFNDTLAAAYAEAGDFTNAIKYQKIVLQREKDPELSARLKLYKLGKPYRSK